MKRTHDQVDDADNDQATTIDNRNNENNDILDKIARTEDNVDGDLLTNIVTSDDRIGYPVEKPNYPLFTHGWFFPSHIEMIDLLSVEKTPKVIIELGAWLGRSATHFAKKFPDALIFSVDKWDNDLLLQDSHYNSSGENLTILNNIPIYDQYLSNTWNYGYHHNSTSNSPLKGIVPMRMDTIEALKCLHKHNLHPDVIYIDANHHYDFVYTDIDTAVALFPNAHIIGDDWDYPDVQRAAKDIAKKRRFECFEVGNKCWSFSKKEAQRQLQLKKAAEQSQKESNSSQANNSSTKKKENLGKMSMSDLLTQYKKR